MRNRLGFAIIVSAILTAGATAETDVSGARAATDTAPAERCGTAESDYQARIANCDSMQRGRRFAEQCRAKALKAYESARNSCVSARKSGEGQKEFLIPDLPPKEPPPKEPTPPQEPKPK